MATWASLTPSQQLQVQNYVDMDLRPAVMGLARALARASVVVLPSYLNSPGGSASTLGAPSADSVAGIIATLAAGETVATNTGLATAGPILASKTATYTTSLNTLLTTYFSAAAQQDYAQICGSINLLVG